MAVRRKEGENLKRISDRDRDAGIAMNNVHAMKREHLHAVGLNDSRINAFYWDKVFDRIEEPKTGEFIWIKGPNYDSWMKENTDVIYRGKGSSNQDGSKYHDLKLADHYCFNLTREEQLQCKTEAEQRHDYIEVANARIASGLEDEIEKGYKMLEDLESGAVSMCDLAYTNSEGVQVAYEVVTIYYTKEMIEAKETYCSYMEMEYTSCFASK